MWEYEVTDYLSTFSMPGIMVLVEDLDQQGINMVQNMAYRFGVVGYPC